MTILQSNRSHLPITNQVRPSNPCVKREGNGRQRDYVAYDLAGKGTFTNLVNQLDVTTHRHVHSTQTEAQQIRIIAKIKQIQKKLDKEERKRVTLSHDLDTIEVLNALTDRLIVRLAELQAIVARRKLKV